MEVGQAGHSLECVSLMQIWSGARNWLRSGLQIRYYVGSSPIPTSKQWCFSSVGESVPLITARSQVRSPEALPKMAPSSTLVRILDFQSGETGSTPVGATKIMCRWVSGLNHLTVNQALKSNASSNLARHTKIYCPFVYLAGRLILSQESLVRTQDGHPKKMELWCK
jgi:hypothetical protein